VKVVGEGGCGRLGVLLEIGAGFFLFSSFRSEVVAPC
jgi:hypothetical protein